MDTAIYGSVFPGEQAEFRIANHSDSHPYSVSIGSVTFHLTDTQARTLSVLLTSEIEHRDALGVAA